MAQHTWNQAIDAQPGHCWAALLVGTVNAVPVLIVCCVVEGDLLPVLWPGPRALLKVLQQASSAAVGMMPCTASEDGGLCRAVTLSQPVLAGNFKWKRPGLSPARGSVRQKVGAPCRSSPSRLCHSHPP